MSVLAVLGIVAAYVVVVFLLGAAVGMCIDEMGREDPPDPRPEPKSTEPVVLQRRGA